MHPRIGRIVPHRATRMRALWWAIPPDTEHEMSKTDKKRVNSIITVTRFDNKLTFAFAGVGQFVFDPDTCSAENRARAMIHGFEQRIRDAAALSVDRDTGKSATAQAKFEAAKRISDHLTSGATEWNLKAAASTGVDAGLTLLAIMRVYGKTLDEAEAIIASTMVKRELDRTAALKLWASSDKVAKAILDIKRERLDATTDSDDLLDEIESADVDGGGEDEEQTDDESDDEAPL
jgi:hypothetical protein